MFELSCCPHIKAAQDDDLAWDYTDFLHVLIVLGKFASRIGGALVQIEDLHVMVLGDRDYIPKKSGRCRLVQAAKGMDHFASTDVPNLALFPIGRDDLVARRVGHLNIPHPLQTNYTANLPKRERSAKDQIILKRIPHLSFYVPVIHLNVIRESCVEDVGLQCIVDDKSARSFQYPGACPIR